MAEQKNQSLDASGTIHAVQHADDENYLGDPATVEWLLRNFAKNCLDRLPNNLPDRPELDMRDAATLADILLGKVPAYPPLEGWNAPGFIDQWLLEETGLPGKFPEDTVTRVLVVFLCRMYNILKQCDGSTDDAGDKLLVDGLVQEYSGLLMGNPQWRGNDE